MKKILIIGGGFMGSALSELYDNEQYSVFLYERDEQRRLQLKRSTKLSHVTFVSSINEHEHVDFIIEATPEQLQSKQQIVQQIDALFPKETIICTNTSSFLISEIGDGLKERERLIGTHYFSPAHITPLVEVVPTVHTSQKTIDRTMALLQSIHKKPMLLRQEIEGFIGNRLQAALAREAMSLVEKGVATAQQIDEIAKWSIGIRLAMTGPLEQRDINGLDTHAAVANYVYPTLENSEHSLHILENHVQNNELGMKTGKGFYDWTEVDVVQYTAEKEEMLRAIIEAIKKET